MTAKPWDINSEHLLRELAPQVLGAVIRRFRDFTAAEDAVQEALLAAAVQWPREGVPDNPGAWLITGGPGRGWLRYGRLAAHHRLLAQRGGATAPGNRRGHGDGPTSAGGRR